MMNESLLRACLTKTQEACRADSAQKTAIDRLRPDINRTAARLGTKRAALRQYLAFLTCVCAFLLGATAAYFLWPRADAAAPANALWFVGAPMALTLLIAPLMAYFLEKEREHEKA